MNEDNSLSDEAYFTWTPYRKSHATVGLNCIREWRRRHEAIVEGLKSNPWAMLSVDRLTLFLGWLNNQRPKNTPIINQIEAELDKRKQP